MHIKSILSFLLLFLCHLLLSVDCIFKARDIPKSLLFKMSSVPEGCIACGKSVELSAVVERYFEFLRYEWTGYDMEGCSFPLSPLIYRNAL